MMFSLAIASTYVIQALGCICIPVFGLIALRRFTDPRGPR